MKNRYDVPTPLNSLEKYLYGIVVRLDDITQLLLDQRFKEDESPEEDILEEQVSFDDVEDTTPLTKEEEELQKLLSRRDYDNMLKDELLTVLAHRAEGQASKYMRKDELVGMAKETCPDKEG